MHGIPTKMHCGEHLFRRVRAVFQEWPMIRTSFIAAVSLVRLLELARAQAEDVTVGSLKISSPWARATPKGAFCRGRLH